MGASGCATRPIHFSWYNAKATTAAVGAIHAHLARRHGVVLSERTHKRAASKAKADEVRRCEARRRRARDTRATRAQR